MSAAATELQVLEYLTEHPDFFDRHADILADVHVRHPQTGRVVPLAERQLLVVRDKLRSLELRQAELLRLAQEHDAMTGRLIHWARALLLTTDPVQLPEVVCNELVRTFGVPQVAVKLWGLPARAGLDRQPWAAPVAPAIISFADGLKQPYCGTTDQQPTAAWLDGQGEKAASMAAIALRVVHLPNAFGLLVLGSPDPRRFSADLGTAFLERLSELASSALLRLRV